MHLYYLQLEEKRYWQLENVPYVTFWICTVCVIQKDLLFFFMFCSISLQRCSNSVQWTRGGGLHHIILVKISGVPLPSIVNSYIITSPESGVSDIKAVTQMNVLTFVVLKVLWVQCPDYFILTIANLNEMPIKLHTYSPCFY